MNNRSDEINQLAIDYSKMQLAIMYYDSNKKYNELLEKHNDLLEELKSNGVVTDKFLKKCAL